MAHAWLIRLIIGAIILILSFIGLVVADLRQDGAWDYWRWMVPIFAAICLWLGWYLRYKKHSMSLVSIWQEILHWIGVILSIYLITLFVRIGIMGRVEASLVIITILALSIFLAGIYIETTFILIGVILGLFAVASAFAQAYLYTILLPILIVGLALLGVFVHLLHRKASKEE